MVMQQLQFTKWQKCTCIYGGWSIFAEKCIRTLDVIAAVIRNPYMCKCKLLSKNGKDYQFIGITVYYQGDIIWNFSNIVYICKEVLICINNQLDDESFNSWNTFNFTFAFYLTFLQY